MQPPVEVIKILWIPQADFSSSLALLSQQNFFQYCKDSHIPTEVVKKFKISSSRPGFLILNNQRSLIPKQSTRISRLPPSKIYGLSAPVKNLLSPSTVKDLIISSYQGFLILSSQGFIFPGSSRPGLHYLHPSRIYFPQQYS